MPRRLCLPFLVAGVFLADERFSVLRLAGVAIGLFGVVVMIGTDALGWDWQQRLGPDVQFGRGRVLWVCQCLWPQVSHNGD